LSAKNQRSKLARIAVYLAAAWLVTWALLKLFVGSPASLPETVRSLSPFDPDLTFRVAIALELSIFCLAVLKPHLGWVPLAALFAFFVALLVPMVASGAESCGCGGGAIKMKPILMLSVDAALLLAILLARPWRWLSGPGLSSIALVIGIAIAWAAPWLLIHSASTSDGPLVVDSTTGKVTSGGTDVRYGNLVPARGEGQESSDVADLSAWVPAELQPIAGSIVFWRQSSDVCADHLREMAGQNDGTRQVLLVQVRDDLKNERACGDVATLGQRGIVTQVLSGHALHPH
jgi:hypothetical protein